MLSRLSQSSRPCTRTMTGRLRRTGSSPLLDNQQKSSDDFDDVLKREVEAAKEDQRNKIKRKKTRRENGTKELRDSSGFRIRLVDSNNKKTKQVDPEYEVVVEGPLRKIKPYYFTYKTFCKLRWRDRNLFEVFVDEFRDRDEAYYKKTIASGSVFLNDEAANLDSIIRNGDLITHKLHRHEPPVTSRPIKTVFENDDILVIDKPSGIPVHPTGRYRFNTITKILEQQIGRTVHPCNRLDRLTSGLMFMAKTPKGADEMADQLKAREVTKEYVARVVGEFPCGDVCVDVPVKSVEPKLGLNAVCKMYDDGAKHAKTIFRRISYDGVTSVVQCKPLTGRTHQIRVHLQYLGHPIANDPIYSNTEAWGPTMGKNGEADFASVIFELNKVGRNKAASSWLMPNSEGEVLLNQKCSECCTELYTSPGPNDLDLWLHAFRYESTEKDPETNSLKWSYHTEFPDWALEPHKKYMELAITEASKCGPTTTAFSVGAVLVNGTEVLSTGYSRELPGNTHAEQCALEKYFEKAGKRDVPEGTVIYTTMEPCSFRLSGNLPCVQRIIETSKIKSVFVGIMEPDTFVKNNTSFSLLRDAGVGYFLVPGYEDTIRELAIKGHHTQEKSPIIA